MKRLAELQRELSAALRSPRPIWQDDGTRALADRVVRGQPRLSAARQLELYREQFFFRHLDAVAEDFPALVEALGWDAFEEVTTAYLAAHPPTSFSLRDLAARLPDFLEGRAAPAAVDLARLEWALVEAFDAADAPPIDAAKVTAAGDALDRATITLDASLTLLALGAPVHEVRERLAGGEATALPEARPTWLVVYRRELDLDWREVPPLAHAALSALSRGLPLSDALDEVAARCAPDELGTLEAEIGGWFRQWVADGWIRDVTLP
ncbi:MAG: putative DNA-binding domain-containing protein [Polyangiaceae bacterium]|nr:putative DNA-binding domain-containing protein [Polyangiaceae bacterium]